MAGEKIPQSPNSAQAQTLFTSATLASGTTSGSSVVGMECYTTALFMAKVSAVTGTSPTIDIYIQQLLPDGTTWQDIAHFAQITGTANRIIWFVTGASSETAVQTAALTAATIKAINIGGTIRATVILAGTNPAATVAVFAHLYA